MFRISSDFWSTYWAVSRWACGIRIYVHGSFSVVSRLPMVRLFQIGWHENGWYEAHSSYLFGLYEFHLKCLIRKIRLGFFWTVVVQTMANEYINAIYENIFLRAFIIYIGDPTLLCDKIVSEMLWCYVCWLYISEGCRIVVFGKEMIDGVLLRGVAVHC